MPEYEFHELANIFPLLEGKLFDELVEDIRESGQEQAIVLFEGKILDGRNLYRACEEAGIEPRFTEFSGGDPVRYVISLNLRRRHLDESQRAVCAARLVNILRGGDRRSQGFQSANLHSVSRADAAELLNVSVRTIANAAAVGWQTPNEPMTVKILLDSFFSEVDAEYLEKIKTGLPTPFTEGESRVAH